jgi:hypothetical protein
MNYITFPIKLYTSLTVPSSIILSAINESCAIGCTTKEERSTYVYGLISHVLTTVSIRNNIKRLQKKGILDENLLVLTDISEQITTLNVAYGSPWRKYQHHVENNSALINSLQDAH